MPARGPDYFRDAASLASTLGAAHAIRVRCNGNGDQYWRRYMSEMLGLEAPEPGPLRSSLVGAFNDAFTFGSRDYPYCDARAVGAEAQFASDGRAIANRMATHYFPKSTTRRGQDQ